MPGSSGANITSIKSKARSNAFWGLTEKIGLQILSAIVGLFMTRLLLPGDYGLIAMIDIFIAVGLLLSDAGLSQGFIYFQDTTSEEKSSIFILNILFSVIIYLILFFFAPLIASFFEEGRLVQIIRIFALNLPVQAVGFIYQNTLIKEFKLKISTKIKLTGVVVSGTIGLILSFTGFGVWAIVVYLTSYNLFNTIMFVVLSEKIPVYSLNFEILNKYFRYSYKILGANLLDAFYTNFFTFFIGKLFKEKIAGLYSKARLLQNMPLLSTIQLIQNVSFPLLSKLQNDNENLVVAFKKQQRVLAFLLAIIFGVMILAAEPFVYIVLTEKWLPMVPYLKLLCLLGWFLPLQTLHSSVLNARGRSELSLKIEVFKKAIAIGGVLLTYQYGVLVIIQVQILAALAGTIIHIYFTYRLTGYNILKQLLDIGIPLIVMLSLIYLINSAGGYIANRLELLLISAVLYSALFLLTAILFKFSEHDFIMNLILSGLKDSKKL